ncbi:MAG: NTP transferase domain-containing protein [Lentimicrobiaceae bacterium]|jgi:NDP-sugar pyrophosphorylase family protein|nr:NTP transferase domain-containing protein [Lentimicrobiaceae bacterium]
MTQRKSAMILAAGLGTRLGTLTQNKPKALVTINGITLLQLTIENLVKFGYNHFVVNTHHYAEMIHDFLRTPTFNGFEISISDESEQLLNTGGGILKALSLFDKNEAVLVHNVDVLSDIDFRVLHEKFLKSGDDAWLFVQKRTNERKLLCNENKQLVGWTNHSTKQYKWANKPQLHFNEFAFSGLHFFKTSLFANKKPCVCKIIDLYLEKSQHHRIQLKEINPNYWFDLGKSETLEKAAIFLSKNTE